MPSPALGPIRLGFDVPFEPFGLLNDGRPAGMLVELVGMLLQREGIAHEFVPMTLAATEGALASGKVDALAYKGVTPERRDRMAFSDTLIVSGGALFARRGTPAAAVTLGVREGQTIATPRKGPLWADIERRFPEVQLIDGESYEKTFDLLVSGAVELAALNQHAGIAIAERLHPGAIALPEAPYQPLPIAVATRIDAQADIIAAINRALPTLQADGTVQRITRRWLGTHDQR
mgnify:CR=1 FL=1